MEMTNIVNIHALMLLCHLCLQKIFLHKITLLSNGAVL